MNIYITCDVLTLNSWLVIYEEWEYQLRKILVEVIEMHLSK